MVQADAIKLLEKYVRILNGSGLSIQKAYLYGSFARNEQSIDSDIDVMLVSKQFDSNNMEEKIKAWQHRKSVDLRIEPYTIGYDCFMQEDSLMVSEVKKEGIEILF